MLHVILLNTWIQNMLIYDAKCRILSFSWIDLHVFFDLFDLKKRQMLGSLFV